MIALAEYTVTNQEMNQKKIRKYPNLIKGGTKVRAPRIPTAPTR